MIPSDGPPSAAPDPSPPVPDDEGDRWVLVPATEVEGADAPEVFHWEDLQQELARLCSLSSALRAAGDRKGGLAARLHSVLEARGASLQQDSELSEMRHSLQARSNHVLDLKMRANKLSEDVGDPREQLCVNIRTLAVAGTTLGAAHSKLEVFDIYV